MKCLLAPFKRNDEYNILVWHASLLATKRVPAEGTLDLHAHLYLIQSWFYIENEHVY